MISLIQDHEQMKYDEDRYLREIMEYIESTYNAHYVGKDGVQSMDLILANGHGVSFSIGNAMKYLTRFGKKDGYNKKDLFKAVHYIVLALHAHDKEKSS